MTCLRNKNKVGREDGCDSRERNNYAEAILNTLVIYVNNSPQHVWENRSTAEEATMPAATDFVHLPIQIIPMANMRGEMGPEKKKNTRIRAAIPGVFRWSDIIKVAKVVPSIEARRRRSRGGTTRQRAAKRKWPKGKAVCERRP
jgi:hypothetical protein